MVEDFYWKARESASIKPPPLSLSPLQGRHTHSNSNMNTTTSGADNLTPIEKLNAISSHNSAISRKKNDLTAAFVRDSTSLPIKLLKMSDVDHYSPVQADHAAFMKLYDELFVIAPSLADIPELGILLYRWEEVRQAMEYTSRSKSNSRTSRTSKSNSMEALLPILPEKIAAVCEEDGRSSVGEGLLSSHDSNSNLCRESSISRSPGRTRQSKSSSVSGGNHSVPVSDIRVSDCMHLVDTVDLQVEKLVSYSSSDDGSGDDCSSPVTSPSGANTRKKRADTQDSRDSGEPENRVNQSKQQQQQQQQQTFQRSDDVHSRHATSEEVLQEGANTASNKSEENNSQSTEDLEFFSFPAPVNRSKRRSFILPKFM
jgi:hypothetical protein